MKLAVAVIASVCLLTAGNLPAQYYQATQQARRASAQNDAEQQRIANATGGGAQAAAAGAPQAPAAPVNPALQATLKNITGLRTDFATVAAAAQPDPAQKIALLNDLSQAAQGANKATSDSVKKLANDLQTALLGQKKLAASAQQKLAQQIHALFNSDRLSATQQETLLTSIQNILTEAGASLDSAVDVVTDLKAVITETQ